MHPGQRRQSREPHCVSWFLSTLVLRGHCIRQKRAETAVRIMHVCKSGAVPLVYMPTFAELYLMAMGVEVSCNCMEHERELAFFVHDSLGNRNVIRHRKSEIQYAVRPRSANVCPLCQRICESGNQCKHQFLRRKWLLRLGTACLCTDFIYAAPDSAFKQVVSVREYASVNAMHLQIPTS